MWGGGSSPLGVQGSPFNNQSKQSFSRGVLGDLGCVGPLGLLLPSLGMRTGGPFVPGQSLFTLKQTRPHKAEVPGLGDNPICNQGAALWGLESLWGCVFSLSKS